MRSSCEIESAGLYTVCEFSVTRISVVAWALAPFRETVKAALVHLDESDPSRRVDDAVRTTATDTAEDIREMQEDEAMTRRALDLLGSTRNDAY
jgi:hypothetical protein